MSGHKAKSTPDMLSVSESSHESSVNIHGWSYMIKAPYTICACIHRINQEGQGCWKIYCTMPCRKTRSSLQDFGRASTEHPKPRSPKPNNNPETKRTALNWKPLVRMTELGTSTVDCWSLNAKNLHTCTLAYKIGIIWYYTDSWQCPNLPPFSERQKPQGANGSSIETASRTCRFKDLRGTWDRRVSGSGLWIFSYIERIGGLLLRALQQILKASTSQGFLELQGFVCAWGLGLLSPKGSQGSGPRVGSMGSNSRRFLPINIA